MRIFVLGAGAIGSLYGAKLAAANDVTLIGRPDHVRAIEKNGLRIEGLESDIVRVRAATHIEQISPGALILLTTKLPATADALEPVASLIRDDTTIVALQNGLNSNEIARAAVRERGIVLRGITQFGAIFAQPGTIQYMVKGFTLLEKHARSARIAAVLNAAGLDCRISFDITTEVWRKLIFNCVVNPVTTIIGSKVGGIVDSHLDGLKQLIIDECLAVADAEGVHLEEDFVSEVNAAYAGSQNVVSMQQDLLRGRVTEIDYLNGTVVTLGARHGLECPVNDGLIRIIKAMEATSRNANSTNVLTSSTRGEPMEFQHDKLHTVGSRPVEK
ncbi:MAG TPA: 2-dehydropantoate 2-reductase [Chthoniobacterales bacterium]|jgi:2-dehydropantoate 2-reductase|nr:2-dehydropantoate 2-reductase [Chthoniobacterales bacterium]